MNDARRRTRTDVRRRPVLASVVSGLSLALAGCLDRTPDPVAEEECEDATRPEPELPDDAHDDALEPTNYPEWPGSSSDEAVAEYTEAYERAYRRNELVRKHEGRLVGHGLSVNERTVDDRPGDGAAVRLRYHYYHEVKREDEPPVHGDSAEIVVAYYVDSSVVLRAEATGHEADAPDPLEVGALLECSR